MRLNIGCGPHYAEHWLNVDISPDCGADVVADLRRGLPFEDGAAERIYLGHVLEHLPMHDVVRALQEVERLLAEEGTVMCVGPDARLAKTDEELKMVLALDHAVGAEGGPHQWVPTAPLLGVMFRRAGLTPRELPIQHVQAPWPVVSHVGWQCALEATR